MKEQFVRDLKEDDKVLSFFFAQIIAARRDKTKPWTEYDTLLKRYLYAGQEEEELAIEEAGLLE